MHTPTAGGTAAHQPCATSAPPSDSAGLSRPRPARRKRELAPIIPLQPKRPHRAFLAALPNYVRFSIRIAGRQLRAMKDTGYGVSVVREEVYREFFSSAYESDGFRWITLRYFDNDRDFVSNKARYKTDIVGLDWIDLWTWRKSNAPDIDVVIGRDLQQRLIDHRRFDADVLKHSNPPKSWQRRYAVDRQQRRLAGLGASAG